MRQTNRNIKYLRKSMKLTQEKFAVMVGVKRASIGSYEEDRAIPPADILAKIASACNVSVDELLYHKLDREPRYVSEDTVEKTIVQPKPAPVTVDPLFASLPLFQNFEPEPILPEPIVEVPKKVPMAENEYIPTRTAEPKKKAVSYISEGIPYVNGQQIRKFTRETDLDSFSSTLPSLNFPFIPFDNTVWAFDAPEDFLVAKAVIVASLIEEYQNLKDGQNYLIFFKNGEYAYRRIYNQIALKGIILTNSDKSGINSEEFRIENILYLFEPLSYIAQSMPKPEAEVDAIRNKINELSNLIGKL